MMSTSITAPEVGQLVRVRGQHWVVAGVSHSNQPVDELAATHLPGRSLVTMTSVGGDDLGDNLTVVWEVEPDRDVVPARQLPSVTTTGWDDPQRLGAFLDAVRWGTVASADHRTLQSPFRSGISIEEYQLEPVARALAMPRVNLLIADDVGLGKTIEAGLVIQELLLRHRARRVTIVCPAPLTVKWRGEMASKFGLDFVVLEAHALRELRRTHGLQANPFAVFPRTIISMQWLRSPRVQRLLDEVLTSDTRYPGYFDLLVVDEVHHCAPPAPERGRGYAVDSKQTQAVRRMGEHSQHRLFLSATPHNGYPNSWWALLAMLDPQRFARGVPPDDAIVEQVMVRRLKDEIRKPDRSPQFVGRNLPQAIEVVYTDTERHAHDLLQRYTTARHRASGRAAVRANDLVTLLLKKRLFSSPAAFSRTLQAHAATVAGGGSPPAAAGEVPEWLDDALAWDDEGIDDAPGSDAERELLERAAGLVDAPDADARYLLEQLLEWAERYAEPADSKAKVLVTELERICRPDGEWNDERMIIFTEYVDTQRWLAELLTSRGLGGERLALLFGGMEERRREHLKAAFQASPDRDKVRILLATDSASEGIDLQNHCHRAIHYDIPFNPNRLEQRIGRVDRHGQRRRVDVAHFVGAGWQQASAGSYEADLEFLSRVAAKVATERRDLGSVNPVLATAVEARMLGRPLLTDPLAVQPKPTTVLLRAEKDLRDQVRRLREQLDETVRRLHVAPANVRRVVDTALALADQPPLIDENDGRVAPPDLRAGWERTVVGLADPLPPHSPRPLTFDAAVADDRDDVVLAHLEHPLVAHSTRLLRSAVWGGATPLHRVSAVRVTLPNETDVDGTLVAVFARLVVVGADGARLHEEVMLAARIVPESGRSRRVELEQPRNAGLRRAVEDAFEPASCHPVPEPIRTRFAERWSELHEQLAGDVTTRARERLASLDKDLSRRAGEEASRVNGIFDQLDVTLRSALAGPGHVQLALDEEWQPTEVQQAERDRAAWQSRLDGLAAERQRELAAVERRYAGVRELVFPFAVALCLPERGTR